MPTHHSQPQPYRPPLDPDDLRGRNLAGFQLHGLIGRGGFCAVFHAVHQRTGVPLAVKVLLMDDPPIRQRFWREARIGLRLRHPNLIHVGMAGEDPVAGMARPIPWISSDLVSGTNAARLLHGGPLGARTAVLIVSQLMDALQHAHNAGVVHCDVKPANIMVRRDGTVVLLDFGTAQDHSHRDDDDAPGSSPPAGTAGFMPPEQWIAPESVDGRADLYAAGVTLHALLAGRYPAEDESCHVAGDPHVPESLAAIIRRMTALPPDDRFASATEARLALTMWMSEESTRGVATHGTRLPATPLDQAAARMSRAPRSRHKPTVLLAAAASRETDTLRKVLSMADYHVVHAGDRRSLTDVLTTGYAPDAPDAVVLEPGLTPAGCELIGRLRQVWPDVVVLMLSAASGCHDKLRALMCGADRYLVQPCSPVRVVRELCKLMDLPVSRAISASASETHPISEFAGPPANSVP